MGLEATIAYKTDDNQIVGTRVRGIVYELPKLLSEYYGKKYTNIVNLINSSAVRGGFYIQPSGKLEIRDHGTAVLGITDIATGGADINYFVKDNGEIVSYDPRSIIQVNTAKL